MHTFLKGYSLSKWQETIHQADFIWSCFTEPRNVPTNIAILDIKHDEEFDFKSLQDKAYNSEIADKFAHFAEELYREDIEGHQLVQGTQRVAST